MYTWVPMHREAIQHLFKAGLDQTALIGLLQDMKAAGLKVISLQDEIAQNVNAPLEEIDPFTFFAAFNRSVNEQSRLENWKFVKDRWQLRSEVPADFDGIPTLMPLYARFFPYKYQRTSAHVSTLWSMARNVAECTLDTLDPDLFARCLELSHLKVGMLTIGMFWLNPDTFLSADSKNLKYAAYHGIDMNPIDHSSYIEWMRRITEKLGSNYPAISREAHLYVTQYRDSKEVLEDATASDSGEADGGKRFWVYAPGPKARYWAQFYEEGIMAVGDEDMGDLRTYESKDSIRNRLVPGAVSAMARMNDVHMYWQFVNDLGVGDVIIAKLGASTIVGLGEVVGEYEYEPERGEYCHTRKVKWIKNLRKEISSRFVMKTLTDVTRWPDYVNTLLREIDDDETHQPQGPTDPNETYTLQQLVKDTGIPEDQLSTWLRAIERKKQAVFYGPPGTGKTYVAERVARHLLSETDGIYDIVQFHPAYTYEDFIQGIRPETTDGGALHYKTMPGRFLEFCARARMVDGTCVFIIDEINRANIARVFGELMYLLEYREKEMPLAGGNYFSIPANVRVIGTMNTADRSIALVDFALRRRFAFLELEPMYAVLRGFHAGDGACVEKLIPLLEEINTKIGDRNYWIGISFFLVPHLSDSIEEIWRMEIEPYLEEYFFSHRETADRYRWEVIRTRFEV